MASDRPAVWRSTLENLEYLIAAYSVLFVVLLAYAVSLVVRWRGVRQRREDEPVASSTSTGDSQDS